MTKKTLTVASVAILLCLSSLLFSCKNVNPNVSSSDTETEGAEISVVQTAAVTEKNDDKFVCIGGGREQPQVVDGVTVDVGAMARRSYELCFMLAQTKFGSASDISLDAAVQFAFCLIFYDDLWAMPASGDIYCTASVEEIEDKLEELFGKNDFDVKKSFLYSPGLGKFEMFQPNYGQNLYYNVDSAEAAGANGDFTIITTFYTDSEKTNVLGRTELTVGIADGKAFIKSMSSET